MAMEHSDVILNFDVTEQGGVIISAPHEKFAELALDNKAHETTVDEIVSSPFVLHERCTSTMAPTFVDFQDCNQTMLALHQGPRSRDRMSALVDSWQKMRASAISAHKECSLSFLQECNSGPSNCALTRTADKDTCPREAFIGEILALAPHGEALNPVFYGAGDCFAEMEMSARLHTRGHHFGVVTLIDPFFATIISFLQKSQQQGKSAIRNTDIAVPLSPIIVKFMMQLTQIQYFLDGMQPGTVVAVYASHADFIKDANNHLASNLLVALDYQDNSAEPILALDTEIDDIAAFSLKSGGVFARACSIWSESTGLGISKSVTKK